MIKNIFIILSTLAAVKCQMLHSRHHPSAFPATAMQTALPVRPPCGNLLSAATIANGANTLPLPLLQPPCAKSLPLPVAATPCASPLQVPPCANSLPIPIVTPPCANSLPLSMLTSPYEISLPKGPILGASFELPVSLPVALPKAMTTAPYELALPTPLIKPSCGCREVPVPRLEIPSSPIGNPFLPAASPVSPLAPYSLLPPANPCSRCQHLKKIPIPPPCI